MFSLDLILFSVASVALYSALHRWVWQRHRPGIILPAWGSLALLLAAAAWLVISAGGRARVKVNESVQGWAPTYASEMERLGHERINENTSADNPTFLAIIEAQIHWLRLNPKLMDVATFGRRADGQLVILADSEIDLDRNGRIEGAREMRAKIGQTSDRWSEEFRRAFSGESFVSSSVTDGEAGKRVTSYAPIHNRQGVVVAVVLLEFNGEDWLSADRSARASWLGLFGSLVLLGGGAWSAVAFRSYQFRQRDLHERESRLHAYFESLPFECWAMDKKARYSMLNRCARESWGANAIGQTVTDVALRTAPEYLPRWEENNRRAFAGEVVENTYSLLINGRQKHFQGVIAPIYGSAGIEGILGINLDATARVNAQQAQQASEEKLALHVRQTPLAIIEWDTQHTITAWNPAAEEIFGIARNDALGRNGLELLFSPEKRPVIGAGWRELLNGRGRRRNEHEHVAPDGRRRLCEWIYTPLIDGNARVIGIASFVQDITSRSELETQLRLAQRLESMGRLSGSVAHELNNLFTPVLMHLDMLEDEHAEAPGLKNRVQPIRNAMTQAVDLSQSMLILSRKNDDARPAFQLLNPSVQDAIENLRRTLDPRLRVTMMLAPSLPALPMIPTMMTQVVLNLLLNARDALLAKLSATPTGWQPTIRVTTTALSASPKRSDGESAAPLIPCQCIEVTDTGSPIDDASVPHLFEPFFSAKDRGRGPGLGLAIVWKATHALGGWIEVTRGDHEGASLRVYLPSPPQPAELPPKPAIVPIGEAGRHLMLVEDDELVSKAIAERLRRSGHTVTCANDGTSALALLRLDPTLYDLVITDLNMPRVGGRDLLVALARESETPPPVIVLTGHITSSVMQELMDLGARDVLAKPPMPDKLLRAISAHAGKSAPRKPREVLVG